MKVEWCTEDNERGYIIEKDNLEFCRIEVLTEEKCQDCLYLGLRYCKIDDCAYHLGAGSYCCSIRQYCKKTKLRDFICYTKRFNVREQVQKFLTGKEYDEYLEDMHTKAVEKIKTDYELALKEAQDEEDRIRKLNLDAINNALFNIEQEQ